MLHKMHQCRRLTASPACNDAGAARPRCEMKPRKFDMQFDEPEKTQSITLLAKAGSSDNIANPVRGLQEFGKN